MRTSDKLDQIAPALAKAQATKLRHVEAKQDGNVSNRYATLADVLDVVRPALNEHGITVIQSPGMTNGLVTVTTRLLHESGQWIEGTAATPPIPPTVSQRTGNPVTNPAQMTGAAVRYLCRYALEAMTGVAERDADDADGVPSEPTRLTPAEPAPSAARQADAASVEAGRTEPSVMTDAQRDELRFLGAPDDKIAEAASAGTEAVEKLLRRWLMDAILGELSRLNAAPEALDAKLQQLGAKSISDMTTEQMREAVTALKAQPTPGEESPI